MKQLSLLGIAGLGLLAACGGVDGGGEAGAQEAPEGAVMAPKFEVDPFWPKPLPNHWIIGATIGVAVDSRDHVWIVQRNTPDQFGAFNEIGAAQDPPLSECCVPAPPVLEFDPEGNLVGSWGGGRPRTASTNGRCRTTASPSITWTTCGSAAMAAPTPTS